MSLTIDLSAVRQYCSGATPTSGEDILTDGVLNGVLGATNLVQLMLEMRANRRTRRTLGDVRRELTRPASQRPAWLRTLAHGLLALWRVLHHQAVPFTTTNAQRHLRHLSRAAQRALRPSGLLPNPNVGLASQASQAARAIWTCVGQQRCVLWVDNFVRLRWGTDPSRPSYTQNLTALAVLPLDDLYVGGVRTRGSTIGWFPGHRELLDVVNHVDWSSALCCSVASRLHSVVTGINRMELHRADVRVPLDVHRSGIQSLRWRPLSLTEQNVSSTEDLLSLLETARELQQHSGHQLMLLVDENIHYRVLRLMYSGSLATYAMGRYLADVPLLYGVWHAYKHTLTVVYRVFFPVLALVEVDAQVRIGSVARSYRKVPFMEKMVAALLLCRHRLLPTLRAQILDTERAAVGPGEGLPLLRALRDLLEFYVPAIFHVGYKVRQCAWEGRPDGHVKGDVARHILEYCFLLQLHLQNDWLCRTPYVRTIGIALCTWQPWLSTLPGCVFVEEACEGLLSRLSSDQECTRLTPVLYESILMRTCA